MSGDWFLNPERPNTEPDHIRPRIGAIMYLPVLPEPFQRPEETTLNAVTGLDALHSRIHATDASGDLSQYLPAELVTDDLLQTDIPRIAKDPRLMSVVDNAVQEIPTEHLLCCDDARNIGGLPIAGVHLALTSPPYWTLKQYREHDAQLGHISQYEEFLVELDKVWRQVHDVLVPGGRLICVVGDVCVSRRKNGGRHAVMPLHSSIQEHCREIGFDNLAPIIWHKIANATYEAGGEFAFPWKAIRAKRGHQE